MIIHQVLKNSSLINSVRSRFQEPIRESLQINETTEGDTQIENNDNLSEIPQFSEFNKPILRKSESRNQKNIVHFNGYNIHFNKDHKQLNPFLPIKRSIKISPSQNDISQDKKRPSTSQRPVKNVNFGTNHPLSEISPRILNNQRNKINPRNSNIIERRSNPRSSSQRKNTVLNKSYQKSFTLTFETRLGKTLVAPTIGRIKLSSLLTKMPSSQKGVDNPKRESNSLPKSPDHFTRNNTIGIHQPQNGKTLAVSTDFQPSSIFPDKKTESKDVPSKSTIPPQDPLKFEYEYSQKMFSKQRKLDHQNNSSKNYNNDLNTDGNPRFSIEQDEVFEALRSLIPKPSPDSNKD